MNRREFLKVAGLGVAATTYLAGSTDPRKATVDKRNGENIPSTITGNFILPDGTNVLSVGCNQADIVRMNIPLRNQEVTGIVIVTQPTFEDSSVTSYKVEFDEAHTPIPNGNVSIVNHPAYGDKYRIDDAPIQFDHKTRELDVKIHNSPGGAIVTMKTPPVAEVGDLAGLLMSNNGEIYTSKVITLDHNELNIQGYPTLAFPLSAYKPPYGKNHVIHIEDGQDGDDVYVINPDGEIIFDRGNVNIKNLPRVKPFTQRIDGKEYILLNIKSTTLSKFIIAEATENKKSVKEIVKEALQRIVDTLSIIKP